jgi:hypothetical protein
MSAIEQNLTAYSFEVTRFVQSRQAEHRPREDVFALGSSPPSPTTNGRQERFWRPFLLRRCVLDESAPAASSPETGFPRPRLTS